VGLLVLQGVGRREPDGYPYSACAVVAATEVLCDALDRPGLFKNLLTIICSNRVSLFVASDDGLKHETSY
jgi:hypothetical protein